MLGRGRRTGRREVIGSRRREDFGKFRSGKLVLFGEKGLWRGDRLNGVIGCWLLLGRLMSRWWGNL